TYLSLLEENPATARLLVTLFGTSGFLTRYLLGHPELLDELVLGSHAVRQKSRGRLVEELGAVLGRARDAEERLDALRRFRNTEFLRIALHDLWGDLGPEEVSGQLTLVAEACLEEVCRDVGGRLLRKYGPSEGAGDWDPGRFSVLGLGRLGGAEIDYHSDLDIVFMYEAGRGYGPGRKLSPAEFFARLAQRMISALATRTQEGIAFRMDARLRPSGQAGPLVTSLAAFASYHRGGTGQTWERQALLRLRPVAGDPKLGGDARAVVNDLLFGGAPAVDPRPEIWRMRRQLEEEAERTARGRVDLKAGPGGLLDVEFAVQALQLLHGWREAALQSPNTLTALEALRTRGHLADEDGVALGNGYRFLRAVQGRLRVLQERPTDTLPEDPERLTDLARGLGYPGTGAEAMVRDVERHRLGVRAAYASVLGGGGT
ncbi:MAG: bifunctional [glutamate--ammonia ligase]-adenylyl-L-tyrosine phosphorylase/[glutamate--ammonia-ligase] adenylyltransferase, partial [Proteobacteria bacterium]|nr:bifunctional [glutamate--ammonia ligase]-adenylyl-L-tyrosine phosphorylase/[glutamate--ammonia-ligase] adenylyltransferase [Pseudomonadota bacterium]